MALVLGQKGCWTCKDRKIACDKHQPTCHNCLKSRRVCLGYGMRLSWPRENDRRRGIVSVVGQTAREPVPTWIRQQRAFLNVFSSDIELHNSYQVVDVAGDARLAMIHASIAPRYSTRMLYPFGDTPGDVVVFYKQHVWNMLNNTNSQEMLNIVYRTAFMNTSPGSTVMLDAIHALILQQSNSPEADGFQQKAVSTMWSVTAQQPNIEDALQRIIAVMLLVMFQAFPKNEPRFKWAEQVCWARTASFAALVYEQLHSEQLPHILEWVFYYDLLSKYTMARFDPVQRRLLLGAKRRNHMMMQLNAPNTTSILPTLGCSMELVTTIVSVIDIVLELDCLEVPLVDMVDKLERRLKYIKQHVFLGSTDGILTAESIQHIRKMAELYRLSGLIYLHRAARGMSVSDPVVQNVDNTAFSILKTMDTCERTFPLFIIACEAHTDEQRAEIIRIFDATQSQNGPGNIIRVREFVESFWAQDDLDTEHNIDYPVKITAVLSSSDALSSYVSPYSFTQFGPPR